MYRIMIVEDDITIAEIIRKHMEGWGYEVRCAEDFKNVLAEFVSFSPQLVLMDISLPFFNGYDQTDFPRADCFSVLCF